MRATGELKRLDERVGDLSRIELDNAVHAGDNAWLAFLTARAAADIDLEAEVAALSTVDVLEATTATGETPIWYVLARIEESDRFLLETMANNGAVPHRIRVDGGQLTAVVSVRDWDHLKAFADEIESTFGSFELLGTTQVDALTYPLGAERLKHTARGILTEEQLHALETSYRMGYFAVPQRATSEDVAERLDISQSTLSTKLRNAQYRLLEILFGDANGGRRDR